MDKYLFLVEETCFPCILEYFMKSPRESHSKLIKISENLYHHYFDILCLICRHLIRRYLLMKKRGIE